MSRKTSNSSIKKEISDLTFEIETIKLRLEKATDESAILFLQNLLNYNEEIMINLIKLQEEKNS